MELVNVTNTTTTMILTTNSIRETMNTNELILDAVRNALSHAERDHYHRRQNHAVCVAKKKMWDNFRPSDGMGGLLANPHTPESLGPGVEASVEKLEAWREAYDHAIHTFVGDQ